MSQEKSEVFYEGLRIIGREGSVGDVESIAKKLLKQRDRKALEILLEGAQQNTYLVQGYVIVDEAGFADLHGKYTADQVRVQKTNIVTARIAEFYAPQRKKFLGLF